ncbi:hypothetical protein HYX11_01640 [Candidatus Woesearchaeota archaeon]|nr:hypothetical protein [Candidatus Woesearchaeota archaeon]
MIIKENLKKYFWAVLGAIGMICFWAGVWAGIGELPYLENPLISLVVGMAILTFSGTIYKEFDPLKETEEEIHQQLHQIHTHPEKHLFHIKYFDNLKKQHVFLRGDQIAKIEKGFIILFDENGREVFVPGHRVLELMHKGKPFWRVHDEVKNE